MKILFDLFPVIAFFITLKVSEKFPALASAAQQQLAEWGIVDLALLSADLLPIMLATLVVILASIAQIIWVKWRHGKVDKMLWISAILVIVMGGLTLYLQNPNFIKWKPTLLYWLFALILLFAQWISKKNLLKTMMGQEIRLPATIWQQLTYAWVGFFVLMGVLNLYVAYHYSTDVWASFKLFGSLGLTLLFIFIQALWMQKYIQES
jgi:intracellular septation protein